MEEKVIKYTFSKAALTSSLGTAVVILLFIPHYPLAEEIYFFSSTQDLCTEVVGSCFVVSDIFLLILSPRDAIVPTE